jgi:hypothetical protein
MNESTLSQLKIIVERAVRPVQASFARKRKMREELLAHVLGVFEEESAKVGNDQAALERTASRFGNPAEVTSQLQETVPARDAIRRYWEGQPGEPVLRTAIRFAWVFGVFALAFVVFFMGLLVASLQVGPVGMWPRTALIQCVYAVLAIPVWLCGLVVLTSWMKKALSDYAGRSRPKVALVAAGTSLFMLLLLAAALWPSWSALPSWSAVWNFAAVLAGIFVAPAPVQTYALAEESLMRRRYHEEWAQLDIA